MAYRLLNSLARNSPSSRAMVLVALTLALLATPPPPAFSQPATEPVSCGGRCGIGDPFLVEDQVRFRPAPASGNVERWYSFTIRSLSPGFEHVRQILLAENKCNSFPDSRALVSDPSNAVSYFDPAWSADGRFLAYVRAEGTLSSIYIQEFQLGTTIDEAVVKVGEPRLIVAGDPGIVIRRPDWRRDGLELAFDSNALGTPDLYTVAVDPAAPPPVPPTPVRRTFVDTKAETNPAYSPDGRKLAYVTNRFGPRVIEILGLETGQTSLAEANFTFVSHDNPCWSSDGGAILYDAPANEDPTQRSRIWCLKLATQTKQQFPSPRAAADADVDVSHRTNLTTDGSPFNYMLFTSSDPGPPCEICIPERPGPGAWRGVTCCSVLPPTIDATVDLDPNTVNLKSYAPWITAYIELDGREAASIDVATVRLAGSVPAAIKFAVIGDHDLDEVPDLMVRFARAAVDPLLTPGQNLLEVTGSLMTGENFSATDEIMVIDPPGSPPSASVAPNPLNPAGVLTIRTSSQGVVTAKLFDLHGRLTRTLMETRVLPAGLHHVPIDGRGEQGEDVASGVYFYRIETSEGTLTGRFAILR